MIYLIPETRQKILGAAWDLFLSRGFFDTQMIDVARAVPVSRTSLYRYFQDKTDLAAALLEQVFYQVADEEWRKEVEPGASARTELKVYLKGRWLSPRYRDQFRFLAEFDAYFSGNRVPVGFRKTLADHLHFRADPVLADLFARGAADGSLRADLDPHLTQVTLVNAIRGLQQRVLLRGDLLIEAHPGEPEQMPLALVDLLIDGLRPVEGVER
jgi:AcrR family transcriptional regulator